MAHVEKVRLSKTEQPIPFHSVTYEEILSLIPEDDYEVEQAKLINRVNKQINIELKRHKLAESVEDLLVQEECLSEDVHRIQLQVDELRRQREELRQEINELINQKNQFTQSTLSEDKHF